MILSLLTILSAMVWLAIETKGLTVNLAYIKPIAVQCNEHRKHYPRIEPCRIINAPYREHYTYKVGDFTALELPELTTGNINIFCKRC
jgi:hypothetical protein